MFTHWSLLPYFRILNGRPKTVNTQTCLSLVYNLERVLIKSTLLFCHLSIWNCRFRLEPKSYSTTRAKLTKPPPLSWAGTVSRCRGCRAACSVGRSFCGPLVLWAAHSAGRSFCGPLALGAACSVGRSFCGPHVPLVLWATRSVGRSCRWLELVTGRSRCGVLIVQLVEGGWEVTLPPKLQAPVYHILPSTTYCRI